MRHYEMLLEYTFHRPSFNIWRDENASKEAPKCLP
jgi:hypothetical protein